MPSVIENKIGSVFVPVSDMARAVAWYSLVFGVPPGTLSHEDRICAVPMQGPVSLLLDAHRPVTNSSQPLCTFWTADMAAAERFLQASHVSIVRPVDDIGSLLTLTIADPDGNLLMLCQAK